MSAARKSPKPKAKPIKAKAAKPKVAKPKAGKAKAVKPKPKPAKAAKTAKPSKPAKVAKPSKPSKPAKVAKPSKPTKPAKAQAPKVVAKPAKVVAKPAKVEAPKVVAKPAKVEAPTVVAKPARAAKPAKVVPSKPVQPTIAESTPWLRPPSSRFPQNAPDKPKPMVKRAPQRADLGAPVHEFFAKQPPELRPLLDTLRELVNEAAPDAYGSLKWGMPFYTLHGAMMCAITAHKEHVTLILVGSPDAFVDPDHRLSGDGSGSRYLKLLLTDTIPKAKVREWLKVSVKYASKHA